MNHNSKELIKDYLINNREDIVSLLNPYIVQRDNLLSQLGTEFTNDIVDQFEYLAKRLIADHLSKAMIDGLSPEDILIDVTALNLKHYLESDIINIQKEGDS